MKTITGVLQYFQYSLRFFEMAVNNRLNFVSTAYDTAGRFNGGFTQGSRRSDNIFILQGLIERLNILGKPIFMCMVDFSKAFDLVNRNILFFKLIKSGVHGKVIDTLRSLYKKTYYRVKCHGRLSPIITENIGVYQGWMQARPCFDTSYPILVTTYIPTVDCV